MNSPTLMGSCMFHSSSNVVKDDDDEINQISIKSGIACPFNSKRMSMSLLVVEEKPSDFTEVTFHDALKRVEKDV